VATDRLVTDRLELRVLPPSAATALAQDRARASRILGADLADLWPQPDLYNILHRQVSALPWNEPFGIWVVIERASATVVGDIGFHGPPDESGSVEIGYCVAPGHRRRGYATEAARAIVDWALRAPGVRAVTATCDPENLASVRTLESVGFRRGDEAGCRVSWRLAPPGPGAT
jgi:RimJ/RimL family protein N-acetyltransferase